MSHQVAQAILHYFVTRNIPYLPASSEKDEQTSPPCYVRILVQIHPFRHQTDDETAELLSR